jgi:sugar phosphate isomerase/epimerase
MMKHYSARSELRGAMAEAASGGQALFTHVWTGGDNSPEWFRGKKTIGKLFDQDARRLAETARALGAEPIVICRPGERGQHIDLEGEPLRRAINICLNTAYEKI